MRPIAACSADFRGQLRSPAAEPFALQNHVDDLAAVTKHQRRDELRTAPRTRSIDNCSAFNNSR
jgi:hypothetical protein